MRKLVLIALFASVWFSLTAQDKNSAAMDTLLQRLEDSGRFMGSVAVHRNGEVLYSGASGFSNLEEKEKATTATRYRIGSISKTFTAVMVLMAAEEGKLSLNDRLSKYISGVSGGDSITLKSMLNHSSGLHNFTSDFSYRIYYTQAQTRADMLRTVRTFKPDFAAGSKHSYSNTNYLLLTYVLEDVYGKSYEELLQEKITEPLGLPDTYPGRKTGSRENEALSYTYRKSWQTLPETHYSIAQGAGGLVSVPTDLNRFLDALFQGKLISRESLAQMTDTRNGFGLGIFSMPYAGAVSYGHSGGIDGFRSQAVYDPADRFAVSVTGNGVDYDLNQILLLAKQIFYGNPYQLPERAILRISGEILEGYTGKYSAGNFPLALSIFTRDEQLYGQVAGQGEFPLVATALNTFSFAPAGVELIFSSEDNTVILKQNGLTYEFSREED